jgi:hypothetical protein
MGKQVLAALLGLTSELSGSRLDLVLGFVADFFVGEGVLA